MTDQWQIGEPRSAWAVRFRGTLISPCWSALRRWASAWRRCNWSVRARTRLSMSLTSDVVSAGNNHRQSSSNASIDGERTKWIHRPLTFSVCGGCHYLFETSWWNRRIRSSAWTGIRFGCQRGQHSLESLTLVEAAADVHFVHSASTDVADSSKKNWTVGLTAAKCVARRPFQFRPKRTLLRANRTRTGRSSSISKRKMPAERPKRTVPGDANRRPGLQRQPTRHSRRTRSTRLSRRANLDPLDVSNDGDRSIRWPNWNCCRCRSGSWGRRASGHLAISLKSSLWQAYTCTELELERCERT